MANNISILDSLTVAQVVKTTDNASVHTPHHNVDVVSAITAVCGQTFTFGAGAVAAGTPRLTLASDDPAVAKLGTIDADTSALFGCVGGTEVQVDIVGALPAGTNAIGKLAANSGVDIGDVDVTSVPADPFGVNADAAVAAGAAGSIQAKLRRATQGLEDLKTSIVLAAGTNAFGKLAANSGIDIGDVDVASVNGFVAHDTAAAGNPLLLAAYGKAAAPADVDADGDATRVWSLRNGSLVCNLAVGGTLVTGAAGLPVAQQGTWTVALSATDNTALDDIVASVQILDDAVYADDAAFTLTTSKVNAIGGIRDDALSALAAVEGDVVPLRVDANGAQWVVVNGTVTVGSHAVTNAGTFVVQENGAALTSLQLIDNAISGAGFNITQFGGAAVPIGAGLEATAVRVTLPTDGTGVVKLGAGTAEIGKLAAGVAEIGNVKNSGTFAVQIDAGAVTSLALIDDPVIQDDSGFTPATSKVMMAGFQADESSTDSVDEGDAGAARMTLDRKQINTPQPHTAGGLSISRDIDLDNGTLTVVKASAGQVYGWTLSNRTTAAVYVKFYDATSGTLGTGTPVLTIEVPGNASDHTTLAQSFGGMGIAFATGICVGAGTGVADADNTDPGANAVVANIYYK